MAAHASVFERGELYQLAALQARRGARHNGGCRPPEGRAAAGV